MLQVEKQNNKQKHSQNDSHTHNWLIESLLLPQAFADTDYSRYCSAGGVPQLRTGSQCGVSEYAGFSCQQTGEGGQNYQICNPLIFGVQASGQPHCYQNVTTEKCYEDIVTNRDSDFEAVFNKTGARRHYRRFAREINGLCRATTSSEVREDCRMIRNQYVLNHRRNLYEDTFVPRPANLPPATEAASCSTCGGQSETHTSTDSELRELAREAASVTGERVPHDGIQAYGLEQVQRFNLARFNPTDIANYCPYYPGMNRDDRKRNAILLLNEF